MPKVMQVAPKLKLKPMCANVFKEKTGLVDTSIMTLFRVSESSLKRWRKSGTPHAMQIAFAGAYADLKTQGLAE